MIRNLLFIFALAVGFAALLYFKPWESGREISPRITDRLPTTSLIGKMDILKLSDNLSKTLFYYKIPFRDFLTPHFILGQGKNYGLDVQNPIYFFAEEKESGVEDWGILLEVRDSSKILEGINRIQKLTSINRSKLYGKTIHHASEYDISLVYGKDWMLIYSGKHLMNRLGRVIYAKHKDVSERWSAFLQEKKTESAALVGQIKSTYFENFDINNGTIEITNDSTSIHFGVSINYKEIVPFSLKPIGPGFEEQEFSRRLVNLHLDVDSLRTKQEHSMHNLLASLGKKINFPTDAFLEAWEGDIAFRQGGIQTIKERYVTSELDEDFNVTEVTKTRNIEISGFSLYLSTNKNKSTLLKQLKHRGILTNEANKYRILYSPPFNLKTNDTSIVLYTGKYKPFMYPDSTNHVEWHVNYTPVQFYMDSIHENMLYGRIQVPLKKIIAD